MYYKGPADYSPGTSFWGGRFVNETVMDDWYGAVRALDPLTGEKVWENRMFQPAWAGLLSTASSSSACPSSSLRTSRLLVEQPLKTQPPGNCTRPRYHLESL